MKIKLSIWAIAAVAALAQLGPCAAGQGAVAGPVLRGHAPSARAGVAPRPYANAGSLAYPNRIARNGYVRPAPGLRTRRGRFGLLDGPLGRPRLMSLQAFARHGWFRRGTARPGPRGNGGDDFGSGASSWPSVSVAPAYGDVEPSSVAGDPAPAPQSGFPYSEPEGLVFSALDSGPRIISVHADHRPASSARHPAIYRFGIASEY